MSRIEYVASKPTSVFPLPRTRLLGNAVARNRTPVKFGQRYNKQRSKRLGIEPRRTPIASPRHHLAHLVHSDHGAAFHELESRYPLTERARGYLLALDSMA